MRNTTLWKLVSPVLFIAGLVATLTGVDNRNSPLDLRIQ